ncbi:curli-like amyloid fiber formation chaperone CsgH [Rhizobium sp. NPDC090279]|uniref:curli-like amyloid fiber formation chaperone CsgH n=1 Tax=Rhizobium sp. NPDC090279 TaxID=3364499 RepID=UPI00383AD29E
MSASSFKATGTAICAGVDRRRSAFSLFLQSFFFSMLLFPYAAPASSQTGVECLVTADRREPFVVVRAIARSDMPVSGTYRLVLIKHSTAGTSHSIQQGSFDLQPGSDNLLATTMVDAGDDTELIAKLLIETDRGMSQCELPE